MIEHTLTIFSDVKRQALGQIFIILHLSHCSIAFLAFLHHRISVLLCLAIHQMKINQDQQSLLTKIIIEATNYLLLIAKSLPVAILVNKR